MPISRVREVMRRDPGPDGDVWEELCTLGLPGLMVPEAFGGSGLGLLDAVVVAHALGYCAIPGSFVGSIVMAAVAITEGGSEEQKKEWLPQLATGTLRVGVAVNAVGSGEEGIVVEDGRLSGRVRFAVDPIGSHLLLVSTSAGRLAMVPTASPGVTLCPLLTVDRTRRIAEVTLERVSAGGWLDAADCLGVTDRLLDAGRVALAADVLGSCDRAIELAVAYAKVRRQFGRLIGSFQAVKHMCSEMAAEVEPCRAFVWWAAHAFDVRLPEASVLAAHVKAHLCEVGTRTVRTATEVHGGFGFTEECDLNLWFKRVGHDRHLLGGPDQMRARAGVLQGWDPKPAGDAPLEEM